MKAITVFLAIAVVVTSWFAWMPEPAVENSALDRVGVVIGKPATPKEIAEVTVTSWDDDSKQARTFQVRRKGESWSIPSHFDYPADGETRIGKTAGILGAVRGRFISDDPASFEETGVVDPTSEDAVTAKERGKRVTLKDGSGGIILDLIVGKVEHRSDANPEKTDDPTANWTSYYVREAGSNEVFTARLDLDISTRFTDWVKPDLLNIQKEDIRRLSVRDYSVNEQSGVVETRAEMNFARQTASADWISPDAPAGKRAKKSDVDGVVNELTWLRLAGIRPFVGEWLQERGFFLAQDPRAIERPGALVLSLGNGQRAALIGNEGETAVTTSNGLTYHCFFGEIALGDDQDTAADSAAAPAKAEDGADGAEATEGEEDKPADAGHNRYLVVFVSYDPADDADAKAAAAAGVDASKPEAAKTDVAKTHQEIAAKANKRFQTFFYVISNASFEKMRPKADALFEDKPAEATARGTDQPISAWLAEHGKTPGVTTTASGLQYEVVDKGREDGKQPTAANRVKVRYTGRRVDGEQFDSSGEATTEFAVTGVIKGWTEALQLMREGAIWRLTIPPGLAYGESGQDDKIGPNEILEFDVELVEVLE